MTPELKPEDRAMAERDVIRLSAEYAECCADCEELRVSEEYPQDRWRAAWDRRMKLQSGWATAAKRLTVRETDPPELRHG